MADLVARRVEAIERAIGPFLAAMLAPDAQRRVADGAADFMAGNPQELALPGFVAALARWSVPQDKDWFAYKMLDPRAQEAAARGLGARLGLAFDAADIILARGASGGLALSLHTVVDPGDEVLFVSPPWFFYEAMILAAGATPVRVRVDPDTFDLDLDAIAGAVRAHTRAIILNTPHNPTGKIYPPPTLERLAALLTEASARYGRPIYVLADEAYNPSSSTSEPSTARGASIPTPSSSRRTARARSHPGSGWATWPSPRRCRTARGSAAPCGPSPSATATCRQMP